MSTTYVYTDGSALNNSDKSKRRAGCAFLIRNGMKNIYLSGYYLEDATNNEAELKAIYLAYCWMKHNMPKLNSNITFKADSDYSVKILKREYTPKKNKNIIDKIFMLENVFLMKDFNITYEHVPAHTKKTDIDSLANDVVDKTARECAKTGKRIKTHFDEKF